MKITADENIIYAEEAFSSIGDVSLLHGREITNEKLKDTDALIVRSITKVNKQLLENTNVRFIGTATIGDDHIDKKYLQEKDIYFTNAKGCNAQAVAEYVFSAIAHLCINNNISLKNKSLGIIGTGNIGSRVAKIVEKLGLEVIKNDPPLQRKSNSDEFRSFEEALQADIITFHVPLNIGGEDNTFHLLNECNLSLIKPGTILINASRGAVIDNTALKKHLQREKNIFTVLDVWENEPNIDKELLGLVDIATPHIAGYSYEGKVNGTVMMHQALCKFYNSKINWQPPNIEVKNNLIHLTSRTLEEQLHEIFSSVYPIAEDDIKLRTLLKPDSNGNLFDKLRKEYPLRRELKNYKFTGDLLREIDNMIKIIND